MYVLYPLLQRQGGGGDCSWLSEKIFCCDWADYLWFIALRNI